jgi:hypothetical protein
VVELRAVQQVICAVIDLASRIDHADIPGPLHCTHNPVTVGGVSGEPGKSSTKRSETALRNGILVVVAVVESEDLPFQALRKSANVPTMSKYID